MRYLLQHIRTITDSYDGSLPLSHYLKNHFRQYPILGSRDRKQLSAMAYSWYRCSNGILSAASFEERLAYALHICGHSAMIPLVHKEPFTTGISFDADKLFPSDISLSAGITREEWLHSMLSQPDLFIRIRKNKTDIIKKLDAAGITHSDINELCMALPNGSKIDSILPADSYVVQDASSQQTGKWFAPVKNESWWDCCSGAGGKSLLLKDMEPSIKLTVSDKRASIIRNLLQRFGQYNHSTPESIITDVSDAAALNTTLNGRKFDHIICDVPCSGSGTWARTPEQLHFFREAAITEFSALQQTIATNAAQHLKDGGTLFYITCSVFSAENEQVTERITANTGLRATEMQLINGIAPRAICSLLFCNNYCAFNLSINEMTDESDQSAALICFMATLPSFAYIKVTGYC